MQIRAMREAASLTQTQLADRLEVDLSTVCHWERGDTVPRTLMVPKLADALGCSIDALYGREPPDLDARSSA